MRRQPDSPAPCSAALAAGSRYIFWFGVRAPPSCSCTPPCLSSPCNRGTACSHVRVLECVRQATQTRWTQGIAPLRRTASVQRTLGAPVDRAREVPLAPAGPTATPGMVHAPGPVLEHHGRRHAVLGKVHRLAVQQRQVHAAGVLRALHEPCHDGRLAMLGDAVSADASLGCCRARGWQQHAVCRHCRCRPCSLVSQVQ